MPWSTTAPALETLLSATTDSGVWLLGDRHVRDERQLRAMFGRPFTDETRRDEFKGWWIHRRAIVEQWDTQDETLAREIYQLRGIQAVRLGGESGVEFQEMLLRVLDTLRDVTTVGPDATVMSAGLATEIDYDNVGGIDCHAVDIDVEVQEVYTVAAPASGTPSLEASEAADRETYEDAATQIEGYLRTVAGAGQVHAERWLARSEDELASAYTVPQTDETAPDQIRAWEVHKADDAEVRGLSNAVVSAGAYVLRRFEGRNDSRNSTDTFQRHIDTVRAVFRGLGNLGNRRNPTAVLQSPLQVAELGSRTLSGYLCHYAECGLTIEEVVHA